MGDNYGIKVRNRVLRQANNEFKCNNEAFSARKLIEATEALDTLESLAKYTNNHHRTLWPSPRRLSRYALAKAIFSDCLNRELITLRERSEEEKLPRICRLLRTRKLSERA
jgi:dTDP-4-dehydrorhamnose reductase